jgi:hypothetical protein
MVKYAEYDWADLPGNVKQAAKVLGYNEELWDDDEDTPISKKSWGELTTEQKAAAAEIGYVQGTWDA